MHLFIECSETIFAKDPIVDDCWGSEYISEYIQDVFEKNEQINI